MSEVSFICHSFLCLRLKYSKGTAKVSKQGYRGVSFVCRKLRLLVSVRRLLIQRFRGNPTFLKSSINLDVFWRLQPFPVFRSLWEAATAANYLSVRAAFMSPRCLVTNVRIVARCHSFSCCGSVTRPCHYIPFSKEERMRGAREGGWEREKRDGPVEWHFVWVSKLLCAEGDNTSHCYYTGWQRNTHTQTLDHNSLRYTPPQCYSSLFSCQRWKIFSCWFFHWNCSIFFFFCWKEGSWFPGTELTVHAAPNNAIKAHLHSLLSNHRAFKVSHPLFNIRF